MGHPNVLQGRNAFVFGATGAVGAAVAHALVRRGANVYLTGRNTRALAERQEILLRDARGVVDVAFLDATHEAAVAAWYGALAGRGVLPDLVFNATGANAVQAMYGTRSAELPAHALLLPLESLVAAQFITARHALPFLRRDGLATIGLLTSGLARGSMPYMAGITAASDAVQGLARVLAAEWTPLGVHLKCLRLAGIASTPTLQHTVRAIAQTVGASQKDTAERIFAGNALTLRQAARGIVAALVDRSLPRDGSPIDIDGDKPHGHATAA